MHGKVREAIEESVARIVVAVDGSLTIETNPGGLLGLKGNVAQLDSQEGRSVFGHAIVSPGGRQWKGITAA